VVEVGDHRGLGRFVEIEHRGKLHSLYAHLSSVTVDVGKRVRQGDVIGAVGKTGNAKHRWITPHLHLEVAKEGALVNPQTLGLQAIEPASAGKGTDARGGD
jgi:murein DD-endopeptidase MepM/ murein hydrolase activator NlpD